MSYSEHFPHPSDSNLSDHLFTNSSGQTRSEVAIEDESRYDKLYQLSPFILTLSDAETGAIIEINENCLKSFGYKRKEMLGKNAIELNMIDAEQRTRLIDIINETGQLKNEEAIMLKKSGERFPVLISTETIMIGVRKYFLNAIIDVSEKKLSDESLRENDEIYQSMVEEVQEYAIIRLNTEGIIQNWNRGAEKIKGYKAEEIIGKSFSIFYSQEARDLMIPDKLLAEASQTGRAMDEHWRIKKDGSRFWGSVVITALHDVAGEITGYVKVTRDLTDRKQAEELLKKKNAELEKKNAELEKMNKELESFAYISSHDLQEPLRKIQIFSSRIMEKDADTLSDTCKDYFGRMQASAKRMQVLIEDLLAYSRSGNIEKVFNVTSLNTIVDEVTEDLKDEIAERNATIEVGKLCEVRIIHYQFRQLLQNLISNSLKFHNPEVPLRITLESKHCEDSVRNSLQLSPDKEYCHITISDNGIGFDPQYSDKIFELFQRLHCKTEYKGTGIGLSIVKRIVDNHNGIITAHGEPGKGATFNIYIPGR